MTALPAAAAAAAAAAAGGLKMQDLKTRDHRNMTGNWRTSYRK